MGNCLRNQKPSSASGLSSVAPASGNQADRSLCFFSVCFCPVDERLVSSRRDVDVEDFQQRTAFLFLHRRLAAVGERGDGLWRGGGTGGPHPAAA